jgi:hypothetical protein
MHMPRDSKALALAQLCLGPLLAGASSDQACKAGSPAAESIFGGSNSNFAFKTAGMPSADENALKALIAMSTDDHPTRGLKRFKVIIPFKVII